MIFVKNHQHFAVILHQITTILWENHASQGGCHYCSADRKTRKTGEFDKMHSLIKAGGIMQCYLTLVLKAGGHIFTRVKPCYVAPQHPRDKPYWCSSNDGITFGVLSGANFCIKCFQVEFYGGSWAWPMISHISMPLAIFYRYIRLILRGAIIELKIQACAITAPK